MNSSDKQDRIVVDLVSSKEGFFGVVCKVKGVPSCLFLDTGAGRSAIHSAYTDAIGLRIEARKGFLIGGVGSKDREEVNAITVPCLSIGNVSYKDLLFVSMDISFIVNNVHPDGRNLLGLLGADFLLEHKAIIDYENCSLSLLSPQQSL